jgi:3-oxoacyl-[acyl-carrier protein] reductase
MDLGLAGKIAVVSGSSRGLGYAAAVLLAEEGARVAINGRDEAHLLQAARKIEERSGAEIFPVIGDVSRPEDASALIEKTAAHFGWIDILITNSGGPPAGNFEFFSDQDWQKAVELTFFSHVRLIRAALSYLRRSSAPAVLTITSYAVKQPVPNLVLSNSIRAATVGLTKSLALELGGEGIRFNSILPGWTTTERVTELMADRAAMNQTTIEIEIEKQARESALGRIGTPEEVARAAVFLVFPAASYITGVMLNVDGGAYKGI